MSKDINAPQKLVFLHIPKTAGSSFTHILKSLYDDADIFHRMDGDELISLLWNGDDDYQLYIGHYSYNVVALFKTRPRLVTFLREPRARILSHYHYYRVQSEEAIATMADRDRHIVKLTRKYDFPDFISLDLPEIEQGFANVHTRQLAFSTDYPMLQTDAARKALLGNAIAHLESLDFIGIVERFDESLAQFRRLFGLTEPLEAVAVNVNRNSHADEDDAALAVFETNPVARRRVELDLALYQRGQVLFDAAGTAPRRSFPSILAKFRRKRRPG
ncbi:MAG: sulfotransferase family 2 domain-containing protein [Porticoccaceae bacterium]